MAWHGANTNARTTAGTSAPHNRRVDHNDDHHHHPTLEGHEPHATSRGGRRRRPPRPPPSPASSTRAAPSAGTAVAATRETVEAALNRLTKAYAIAMECIRVCHRSRLALVKAAPRHEPSSDAVTRTEEEEDALSSTLVRSSRAARTTYETCILGDSILQAHSPAWTRAYRYAQRGRQSAETSSSSSTPVHFTSASHQATVLELSYLSLVNYADLLLAGLPVGDDNQGSRSSSTTTGSTTTSKCRGSILDRGVVKPFHDLHADATYMWMSLSKEPPEPNVTTPLDSTTIATTTTIATLPEPAQVTVKLAIAAYLDATALDGTDPTVWIKLACAVRRLGRLSPRPPPPPRGHTQNDDDDDDDDTQLDHTSRDSMLPYATRNHHRRLERYALERAVTALPPNEPCNRLALQALREWHQEEDSVVYYTTTSKTNHPIASGSDDQTLVIDLPRYSWSTLGRLLLRTCKERSMCSASIPSPTRATTSAHTTATTRSLVEERVKMQSSNLRVQVSPILTIPVTVLARVVSWLDATQRWRLEATSRFMSSSVISARAVLDNVSEATHRLSRQHPKATIQSPPHLTATPATVLVDSEPDAATHTCTQSDTMDLTKDCEHPVPGLVPGDARDDDQDVGVGDEMEGTVKRVSKRVRSQIMNSGKQAERSGRRNSTEYCLLGATLGCTAASLTYNRLLQQASNSTASAGSRLGLSSESADSLCGILPSVTLTAANAAKPSFLERFVKGDKDTTLERLSRSSLSHFIEKNNIRPVPLLHYVSRFVAHISMYISPVFSSDSNGSLVLSTCLLDCIAMMARQTIMRQELCTCWSTSNMADFRAIELFAIDLLHGELRLKKCEIADVVTFEYDGDCHVVSTLVPILLELVEKIQVSFSDTAEVSLWNGLKVRCYWLAATFYLWRGKLSSDIVESRIAERKGLKWIDQTEQCLRHHDIIVHTPHLSSQRRLGPYWKDLSVVSLTMFKDEIQASSVVLLAQEQYLNATTCHFDAVTQKENRDAFLSIGESLLARYSCPIDAPEGKYAELIDDFVAVHGEELLARSWSGTKTEESEERNQSWFNSLLPTVHNEGSTPILRLSNPCILSILVSCFQARQEHSIRMAQLLVRLTCVLVSITEGICSRMKLQSDKMNQDSSSSFSDFDEDDSIVSDNSADGEANIDGSADTRRLRQHATMLPLMLAKVCELCRNELNEETRVTLARTSEFTTMMRCSLFFAANWFSSSRLLGHKIPCEDLGTFLACKALFHIVSSTPTPTDSEIWIQKITCIYVEGLFQIIVSQRYLLALLSRAKPSANGRSDRLRTTRKQTDLVAAVCCEVGLLMTKYPVTVCQGKMKLSSLFTDENTDLTVMTRLATFCDALLWFWRAAIFADGASNSSNEKNALGTSHLMSYIDASARERLRVPVASAIIGFLGSASSSFPKVTLEAEISLAEFCDSDASAVEDGSTEDDDTKEERNVVGDELLRVIMQIVHCASCVFSKVEEKEACRFAYVKDYVSPNGPCLPLVVARVLNCFAYHLLADYKGPEQAKLQSKWSDYPVGARTVGVLLDTILYRAYKCLHGFTLTRDTKESAVSNVSHNVKHLHQVLPESEEAAAMLYRCMTRAYSQGRRSPPKPALDIVRAALPPRKDSQTSEAIHGYIFSDDISNISPAGLISLVRKRGSWESSFSFVKTIASTNDFIPNDMDDETTIVYRGLAKLIAQGPIPRYQETNDEKEWRACTAQTEEDLSTKFFAIIDDLCFSDITDSSGWFKASQCLSMKADLIADRLGLQNGFLRNPKFVVGRQDVSKLTYDLADLDSIQEHDQNNHDQCWLTCLGSDLSCFVRYSWSSFDSLKRCSAEIRRTYRESFQDCDDDGHIFRFRERVTHEIHDLLSKKEVVRWQEVWGGLFVSSIRLAAYRCISLALFMSHSKVDPTQADNLLRSEILESLGLNIYAELLGSQSYGYPMTPMPIRRKRKLAETALACFEQAIELQLKDDNSSDIQPPWDLSLMIGKCREKIAKTYEREKFAPSTTGSETPMRRYEFHMKLALQSYATSVQQAREIEKDGGFTEQHGGSAHGAVEAIYRLQASRLKCLISAVGYKEDERGCAEWEALRLTECHWHIPPNGELSDKTLRERVWVVLADVVGALAKCSQDYSFFHRSVYRHAQALLWSPVLCNPAEGFVLGSLGTVPATMACEIRGLDARTNAAANATSVIGSLFTKKRTHLVSAWVTGDGTASALQALNASIRKYDSLRGKYIAAYLDCLRLSRQRKDLDTFLSWTLSPTCPRDLPSYFAASALNHGGKPAQSQIQDTLLLKNRSGTLRHFLTSVRCEANGALASVVGQDLHDASGIPTKPADKDKFFDAQLKVAYACFLRLNCGVDDLMKSRSWKYDRKSGIKDVVDVVSAAYLKVEKPDTLLGLNSSWSVEAQVTTVFQKAVLKCKELYPTLSSNFSLARPRISKKKQSASAVTTTARSAGSKRSAPSSPLSLRVTKSFEVSVPEGLCEGETFLTSIPYGDEVKKLRLAIPAGEASSVQFTLDVPANASSLHPL